MFQRFAQPCAVALVAAALSISGSALAQPPPEDAPPPAPPAAPPPAAPPPAAPPNDAGRGQMQPRGVDTTDESNRPGGTTAQPPPGPPPPPPAPYPAPYPQPYPQTYPQPYPQPYGQPYTPPPPPAGYGQGYGTPYGAPPLRPVEPPPKACCAWSIRYDPFDLISGQITLEGEFALGDLPLSIEIVPSWIFDNFADGVDESGVDIAARFGWYVQGDALRGFYLKAHAGYQHFEATIFRGDLDNESYFGKPAPDICDPESGKGSCTSTVSSFILGLMLGNSAVFGDDGGFALTGGLGVGVAVAQEKSLRIDQCTPEELAAGAPPCDNDVNLPGTQTTYFEGAGFGRGGRVNIMGSLSLGVTF